MDSAIVVCVCVNVFFLEFKKKNHARNSRGYFNSEIEAV